MLRRLVTLRVVYTGTPKLTAVSTRHAMSASSSPTVQHDEKNGEFYILTENNTKAMLQYNLVGGVYDMYHTFVPAELRGAGLARVLADHAFEHVSQTGGKMKLTCSYLDHIHKRNPDSKYSSLVVD